MPPLAKVPEEAQQEWLQLCQTQRMVRMACTEVLGAALKQLSQYRREVLDLQNMEQVLQLQARVRGQKNDVLDALPLPPASPSSSEASTLAVTTPLELRFDINPEVSWYEGRAFPEFTVTVHLPSGDEWADDGTIVLRAFLRNGRGEDEERRSRGTGDLLAEDGRNATVVGGQASWTKLRIGEASSKHHGSFTLCVHSSRLARTGRKRWVVDRGRREEEGGWGGCWRRARMQHAACSMQHAACGTSSLRLQLEKEAWGGCGVW